MEGRTEPVSYGCVTWASSEDAYKCRLSRWPRGLRPLEPEPSGLTDGPTARMGASQTCSGANKERFLRPDLKMLIRFRDIKHDNLMVFGGN